MARKRSIERVLTDLIDYDLAFEKYNHKELAAILGVSYRNVEESSDEYYNRKRANGKSAYLFNGKRVYNNEDELNSIGAWNKLKQSGIYQTIKYG